MTAGERVVFDCNVLFQALVSPGGPARKLVELAGEGTLALYSSSYVLDEFGFHLHHLLHLPISI